MRKLLLALVTAVVLAAGIGWAEGDNGQNDKSGKASACCCCSKSCPR